MTGEQLLNSIRYLDNEIGALDYERCRTAERRLDLLEKAECLGAALNGVHVQHSVSSKTESIGVQLGDLNTEDVARQLIQYQAQLNQKIDELIEKKKRARIIIDHVPDARHRALLTHRYLSNLKWSSIADIMGYTQNWLEFDLKHHAVEAFEKAMKTTM